MTQEEFLRNPYRALCENLANIPLDWVELAWSSATFRDEVIYDLGRNVSKSGDFSAANNRLMSILSQVLTADQCIALYEGVRDESGRMEYEWRNQFASAFPTAAGSLPPSQDPEHVQEDLWQAIESGDGRAVTDLVAILPLCDGRWILSDTSRTGKTLAQAARERGQTIVAEILEQAESQGQ